MLLISCSGSASSSYFRRGFSYSINWYSNVPSVALACDLIISVMCVRRFPLLCEARTAKNQTMNQQNPFPLRIQFISFNRHNAICTHSAGGPPQRGRVLAAEHNCWSDIARRIAMRRRGWGRMWWREEKPLKYESKLAPPPRLHRPNRSAKTYHTHTTHAQRSFKPLEYRNIHTHTQRARAFNISLSPVRYK